MKSLQDMVMVVTKVAKRMKGLQRLRLQNMDMVMLMVVTKMAKRMMDMVIAMVEQKPSMISERQTRRKQIKNLLFKKFGFAVHHS